MGLFYAVGACLVTRAALMSMFLDRALEALTSKPSPTREAVLPIWHVGSAAVVLAGGLALVLRLDTAAWLFGLSALGQALYLAVLAPVYFDAVEPPDAQGRRQTANAFVIYCAATALVIWARCSSRLQSWDNVGVYWLVLAGGALAAYAAWVLRQFAFRLARPRFATPSAAPAVSDSDPAPFDPTQVRRIKVMADYRCHPLWSMDDGAVGNIAADTLSLSAELTHDLNAWAAQFDASLDPDEPAEDLWTSAQRKAHEARGHDLARRLAAERPDLEVHAWDAALGATVVARPVETRGAHP